MRIEKLEISGLRSHRGNPPTSLELTDKRLVAVVGHTGAGKSSLLEAITFALFGEATYGGKAYEELSSDGRSEITVQLTFSRGDERYQLLRCVTPDRNGKFGNKVIYLRQVDKDGAILSHTERVRDVDKAVSALLGGMTREQFCQAVLLAQNRFAALLEANPADRERLLDTLLGLSALNEARTGLQKTRNAAARNIERLEYRRATLPTDPPAEARAATARAKAMGDIAERAEECGSRLDVLAEEATGLLQQASELEHAAALRTTKRGPSGRERLTEIARTLESLARLEDDLWHADKRTAADFEDAERSFGQATEGLAQAEAEHGASGRHQVVAQQLDTLAALLTENPERVQAVSAAEADLQRISIDRTAAQDIAAAAKAETERRMETHTHTYTETQRAANIAEHAERALSSVLAVVGRFTDHTAAADQGLRRLDNARSKLAEANHALVPLAERREEAQRALDLAIRSDSAAAASHRCHPGDDCPVCGRALPESWVPPAGVDLDAARERAARAEAALRMASDIKGSTAEAHVGARTMLRSALTSVSDAYEQIFSLATDEALPVPPAPAASLRPDEEKGDQALETVVRSALQLRDALGEWLEELRGRLDPLHDAKKEAEAHLKEAADQLAVARAAETTAVDTLARTATGLATAQARREAAAEALESCEKRIADTLAGIDQRWRALVDMAAPDPLVVTWRTLADDRSAVAAVAQRLLEAQSAVSVQEKAAQQLETRRDRELTAPLTGLRTDFRSLIELVNDLCDRLALPGAPPVDGDADAKALYSAASELATLALRAVDSAEERCAGLQAKVGELGAPAAEVVSALVTLIAEADPEGAAFEMSPDPRDPLSDRTRRLVQQVVGGAKRLASEAGSMAASAKKAMKTAKELDERLTALGSWATDLDGAVEVLKKERFPRWARGLKMADLVETASECLSEMTDSRFRFDPALQISDEVAGVVRKASTLSGGEKFEASLALALGVSEIAGRSGVRIETLFLDEGFSGLDQAHLNRALDALEEEVDAGRSVVIITHIGAVADRIQDVLLIQPDGAGGSKTKWLDEEERFELGADLDLAVP